MSMRHFIFCDICNAQGLRSIEFRRAPRKGESAGRRISDGRAWFEGQLLDALNAGWYETDDARHICPKCQTLSR